MRQDDHTPAETESIIRRAGCTTLKRVVMYDGHTAFDVDCHTHRAKVGMLEALAEADASLPDVRRRAEDVTAGARSDAERAERLHAYVQRTVSFAAEPRETFSGTMRTLRIGQGDCDDSARSLMALLRAMGLRARLETLPLRATGTDPVHVAAQVDLGGGWQWLETSIAASPGEHPIAAARRLGITMRPELAGTFELLDEATAWLWIPVLGATVAGLWWMRGR